MILLHRKGFVKMCSLTHINLPPYVVHVLQYRPLQSCFLHCLDHSKPACSLLCAFRIRTSGTCTLRIIKLLSLLESSCTILGAHNVFIQCRGSVLHCSFSFLISFTHVGRISFQNQPNAICTHVGGYWAGSWTD